jgi:hypothetical protein
VTMKAVGNQMVWAANHNPSQTLHEANTIQ